MSKLHVDSVIKSYNTKQILTDVYLSCEKGEIIGLLGKNGAGKSTLLKIIFGSLNAERRFVKVGNIIVNGIFDNKYISYLPQDSFLPSHIKIKKLIDVFCSKEKSTFIKNHELIHKILDQKSDELSGGEKRLLEIMLIVHCDASFVLIDEPFNGVAPIYKEEIKQIVREQSANKGFIITDHDYRNILDIATRTILIHDGGTKEIKGKDELKYWGYIPETA